MFKNRLAIFVLCTAVTFGQSQGNSIAGTWRLAWLERPGADGKAHRIDCSGLLVLTRDGYMTVQVMEHNAKPQTSAGPDPYSQGGYEASWGTYKVDERAHTFTYHVEGALVRALVGRDLPRVFGISGRRMIVKCAHPDENWRVAWEHY